MLILLFSSAVERTMKSTGPPECHAGEPPNNFNCTESGCHSDAVANTGTALLALDLGGAENGYQPGATYKITVSVTKAGMTRAGFQIIALQDNDVTTSPGTITLTEPTRTQVLNKTNAHGHPNCTVQNQTWVEHTFSGIGATSGKNTWTYNWKAPANNVGSVTFYLAGLEANFDQQSTGDKTYTLKKTITGWAASVKDLSAKKNFVVYPNPVKDRIFIESKVYPVSEVRLYDLEGKLMNSCINQSVRDGISELEIPPTLANGIYYVYIKSGDIGELEKVSIMR